MRLGALLLAALLSGCCSSPTLMGLQWDARSVVGQRRETLSHGEHGLPVGRGRLRGGRPPFGNGDAQCAAAQQRLDCVSQVLGLAQNGVVHAVERS